MGGAGETCSTRTAGITIGTDGRFFIDKRYRGMCIGMRVCPVTQEQAEQRLQSEMRQVDLDLARRAVGHADHSMAGHYASVDVGRLMKQADRSTIVSGRTPKRPSAALEEMPNPTPTPHNGQTGRW